MTMKITITEAAIRFYQSEMNLSEGDELYLFVRVGGVGSGGFSVGIQKGAPEIDAHKHTRAGIHLYITEEDAWYFDGMTIDYDPDYDAVTYDNPEIRDVINPNS